MKAVDQLENQTKPFIAHARTKPHHLGDFFMKSTKKGWFYIKIDSLVLNCGFNILLVKILRK